MTWLQGPTEVGIWNLSYPMLCTATFSYSANLPAQSFALALPLQMPNTCLAPLGRGSHLNAKSLARLSLTT